jgi:hypothetical protein
MSDKKQDKADKRAQALRENLRKRKAFASARKQEEQKDAKSSDERG